MRRVTEIAAGFLMRMNFEIDLTIEGMMEIAAGFLMRMNFDKDLTIEGMMEIAAGFLMSTEIVPLAKKIWIPTDKPIVTTIWMDFVIERIIFYLL